MISHLFTDASRATSDDYIFTTQTAYQCNSTTKIQIYKKNQLMVHTSEIKHHLITTSEFCLPHLFSVSYARLGWVSQKVKF